MIRDLNVLQKPGEKRYGNNIEAELAALIKNRDFALEQEKKGRDVKALLAYYDEQIARMRNL